ncbi:MAG: alginate lyase family protein, partial [Verrucomicrobiales bacterium]|nr:alginate lyase family protein [Verrucomicrobiales bacterium]
MTASKLQWYWHRLRAMDTVEIWGRVAEKTRTLTRRGELAELEKHRLGPPRAVPLPSREQAPEGLKLAVAEEAARVMRGQWRLFGWREIQMPNPPDWARDFIHGGSAPLEGESRAPDHRHLSEAVDCRVVWETSRWAPMVTLAQQAWLNGDLEAARVAQCWLWDWCEKNPTGQGIHWCSALEAGIRLIHFCWMDALIWELDDADLRAAQVRLAERVVVPHVWWIWRHRSYGSSANNHLIGELAGLAMAGRRWGQVSALACCAERAWQMLEVEVLRQFAVDGGNREQALHYHLFALELCLQARRWMPRTDAQVMTRLERASAFFVTHSADGEEWPFGDSDDAFVTPLTRRPGDAGEWRDYLAGREGTGPGFWLGALPFVATEARTQEGWQVAAESGMASRRLGSWQLRLDASPLGFGSMAAHGHLDALHLSLWHEGRAIWVDPGTGAYYADASLRAELADWTAHNGPVRVKGRPQPLRYGTFLWSAHHPAPRLEMQEEDAVAMLACDGPLVVRRVVAQRDRVDVLDEVATDEPHQVTWLFAPGWSLHLVGHRAWEL